MDQDLNQKIKIGTVRSQLGKRALAHPNLAEGGEGHSPVGLLQGRDP